MLSHQEQATDASIEIASSDELADTRGATGAEIAAGTFARRARSLRMRRSFVNCSGLRFAIASATAFAFACAATAAGNCAQAAEGAAVTEGVASMVGCSDDAAATSSPRSLASGAAAMMRVSWSAATSVSRRNRSASTAAAETRSACSLAVAIARLLACIEPHSVHLVRRTWRSWPQLLQERIQILRSGEFASPSLGIEGDGRGVTRRGVPFAFRGRFKDGVTPGVCPGELNAALCSSSLADECPDSA